MHGRLHSRIAFPYLDAFSTFLMMRCTRAAGKFAVRHFGISHAFVFLQLHNWPVRRAVIGLPVSVRLSGSLKVDINVAFLQRTGCHGFDLQIENILFRSVPTPTKSVSSVEKSWGHPVILI